MRFANIVFFIVAALIGTNLSMALVLNLPFGIFVIPDDGFSTALNTLQRDNQVFDSSAFYAAETLKAVATWGKVINFVTAFVCAILVVMPALATIRLAEGKLFERRVDRGWKMITWMMILGALLVAIYPAPIYIAAYILACSLLISGYVVTYQWPKKSKGQRASVAAQTV